MFNQPTTTTETTVINPDNSPYIFAVDTPWIKK